MQVISTDNRVNHVLTQYDAAASSRAKFDDLWRECYELYRSYVKPLQEGDDRANLFIPYTFALIETVLPRMTDAMFKSRPFVQAQGREVSDHANAPKVESLIDYQMERAAIRKHFGRIAKNTLIYGTGIGMTRWRYDVRMRRQRQMFSLFGIRLFKEQKAPATLFDGPALEHVDLQDFFPDPWVTELEDAEFCIRRLRITKRKLQELAKQGIYENVQDVRGGIATDEQADTLFQRAEAVGMGDGTPQDPDDRLVELLEYWEADRLIVIANKQVVIRDSDNPYHHGRLPFVVIRDHPQSEQFWGVGEVEPIRYLQRELNALRNQRLDKNTLAIRMPMAYDKGKLAESGLTPSDLLLRADLLIPVNGDPRGIFYPIEINGAQVMTFQEAAELKEDMQTAVGIHDTVQGQLPARKETATAVVKAVQEANIRFQEKIREFASEGLEETAEFFHQLDQQFIDDVQTVRILGQTGIEYQQVSPEEIPGSFDFRLNVAAVDPAATKEFKLEQMVQLAPMFMQSPAVDPVGFLSELADLAGLSGKEKWLKTPQQLAAEQAAAMMGPGASPPQGAPPGPGTPPVPPDILAMLGGGGGGPVPA